MHDGKIPLLILIVANSISPATVRVKTHRQPRQSAVANRREHVTGKRRLFKTRVVLTGDAACSAGNLSGFFKSALAGNAAGVGQQQKATDVWPFSVRTASFYAAGKALSQRRCQLQVVERGQILTSIQLHQFNAAVHSRVWLRRG